MRLALYKSAAKLTVRLTPHRHPRRFAPRAPKPSARPNGTAKKTDRKRGGRGAAPLNRLGRASAFTRRAQLSFIVFSVSQFSPFRRYAHFGSRAIVSRLTGPMYSPSSQQVKSSKRSSFLSSKP